MITNDSFRQFIREGLLGLGITFLLFLILNPVTANSLGAVFSIAPSLLLMVMITSFLGTGFGTRLLATVSSRGDWLLRLLGVSLISWLVAMGSFLAYIILSGYLDYELYYLSTYAASATTGAGIGFTIAGFVGVVFNPVSHYAKVLMSGMISTLTGFVLAYVFIFLKAIPT
jgi:hypothetical protein